MAGWTPSFPDRAGHDCSMCMQLHELELRDFVRLDMEGQYPVQRHDLMAIFGRDLAAKATARQEWSTACCTALSSQHPQQTRAIMYKSWQQEPPPTALECRLPLDSRELPGLRALDLTGAPGLLCNLAR